MKYERAEMSVTMDNAPPRTEVQFDCTGVATGKMRSELQVTMVQPAEDTVFDFATDEGGFHGGDGTAPPPLSMFVASLTACLMTQIRAFAKRMGVSIDDLKVETRFTWDWIKAGRVYETAPKSIEIDVFLESPDPLEKSKALIEAAKKGCFIEQTLGRANMIHHRIKTDDGFVEV